MARVEYPTEYARYWQGARPKIVAETDWERQHLDVLFPGGMLALGHNGCDDCAETIMEILEACRAENESQSERLR